MKCAVATILLGFFATVHILAQNPANTIPSFSFKTLNSKDFTNKDITPGELIFFIFFDTECDHCQRSIQYIDFNYKAFKKTVICLISLDSAKKINTFIYKYGNNLKDKNNVVILQDTRNEFITKFGPRKYPSLFLYSEKRQLLLYDDNEQNLFRFIQQINTYVK